MIGLVKDKLNTTGVRNQNAVLLAKYANLAKSKFPELSDADAGIVSHGLIDGALTFAGGLSVPGLITSMLGVIYGGMHGDFTAKEIYASAGFAWETVRFYPAVVGVPFVATDTTRREDLLIPAALLDKKAWGEDSYEFKIRSEAAYEKIDVAWSGFTKDSKYPNEDHSCPGMAMSKAMMLGFMSAFEYSDWKTTIKPKQATQAPVKWNSFSLIHHEEAVIAGASTSTDRSVDVASTSTGPSVDVASTSTAPSDSNTDALSGRSIVGITVACVAGVAATVAAAVYAQKKSASSEDALTAALQSDPQDYAKL